MSRDERTDDLFDPLRRFGTDPRKLVRPADPDTSHAAADAVDTTRLEQIVYDAIRATGVAGCISDEVRARFPTLPYSSVTARYKALTEKKLIADTGRRRLGRSGRRQRVLIATCCLPPDYCGAADA